VSGITKPFVVPLVMWRCFAAPPRLASLIVNDLLPSDAFTGWEMIVVINGDR
jgi:hypothetical protein